MGGLCLQRSFARQKYKQPECGFGDGPGEQEAGEARLRRLGDAERAEEDGQRGDQAQTNSARPDEEVRGNAGADHGGRAGGDVGSGPSAVRAQQRTRSLWSMVNVWLVQPCSIAFVDRCSVSDVGGAMAVPGKPGKPDAAGWPHVLIA